MNEPKRETGTVREVAERVAAETHVDIATIYACARAAHEANRAYSSALGDNSHAGWLDAPPWQIISCLLGVKGIFDGNGPRESHASWLEQKVRDGWVYGPTKDQVAKTHPCMVAYDDLPPEQRAKDLIFYRVVRAIALARDYEFKTSAINR